ncbi:hypothetical protein PUV54_11165 [Hyphococcus flavus]|uniref:Secreted protein n=1 Tax=Hyphococcus flavus TaxID=1866326 RepID=A0AAE9ZCM3_9PROT|nr:hypothetical protein [Hyphococcus flavus]WDI30517.1 hypothetical protein PUV54_11165 [Hyphococcus flavus]
MTRLLGTAALGVAMFMSTGFMSTGAGALVLNDAPPANYVHENGIGPDPDNDTNPATITGVISRVGDAAQASNDEPYRVITFEAPPGKHGDVIREAYAEDYGVHFGRGVTRQICEGQRRFYYDSMCTYEAAPSGQYAAAYVNHLNAPLVITFDEPVCVVTMAIYPTGGREGERFRVRIKGWDENGMELPQARAGFEWTKYTVRWRHMAGAYYLGGRAKRIEVSMRSRGWRNRRETLRYLIDDLAFVQDGCEEILADFVEDDTQTGIDIVDADEALVDEELDDEIWDSDDAELDDDIQTAR